MDAIMSLACTGPGAALLRIIWAPGKGKRSAGECLGSHLSAKTGYNHLWGFPYDLAAVKEHSGLHSSARHCAIMACMVIICCSVTVPEQTHHVYVGIKCLQLYSATSKRYYRVMSHNCRCSSLWLYHTMKNLHWLLYNTPHNLSITSLLLQARQMDANNL